MNDLERWRPYALAISRAYFLPGAERADLEQEAMLGLFKALRDYRPDGGMSLRNFVALCVRRQVISAVKTATRQKHEPLTWAVRHETNEDGDELAAAELIPDPRADVVDLIAAREELGRIAGVVRDRLSPLERHALIGFATGHSYEDLGGHKLIDNALQRARHKLSLVPPTPLQVAA